MKRRSIRKRLLGRLALVLATVAIVTNAALYLYLRGELVEQYDHALKTQARAVAAVWPLVGNSGDAAALIARAFPDLRFGRSDGHFLRIYTSAGKLVARLPDGEDYFQGQVGVKTPSHHPGLYNLTLPGGMPGRAVEITFPSDSAAHQVKHAGDEQFTLLLAEDRTEMDETLFNFALGLFLVGGSLSVAAIVLVLAIVRRELFPLQDFSDAVGQLNVESLGYRFPADGVADELAPVAARLNELLHRLDEAFARERRFSGNVAHELRTPLAELRSMVEVAMKWPLDAAELRRHQEQVLDVIHRMTSVTQALLALVRSEQNRLQAAFKSVDLIPVVRSVSNSHEPAAAARGLAIHYFMPAQCFVRTDPTLLVSLLNNLFSNAALYAAADSTIECTVSQDENTGHCRVTLTNEVVDLEPADFARLEEPFWRKDAARSASDHAGLGLSLVRAYAVALQIELGFEMQHTNRLAVCLAIPSQ